MRKVDDGEKRKKKKKRKKENNDVYSGHYVIASRPPNGDRLQRRRSCQKYSLVHFKLRVKSRSNPEPNLENDRKVC